MEPALRITRALHQDHMAVLALLGRLGAALDGAAGPDFGDSRLPALLSEIVAAVEGEIADHFALEEEELFPLLEAAGEDGLGHMLAAEHAIIAPLGRRVADLARAGARDGFDKAAWAMFRRTGREFAALLTEHAEKEEIGLLPLLDEVLTEDDDRRLADLYLAAGVVS